MKQFGKLFAIALGFALLAAVLGLVPNGPAGAQSATSNPTGALPGSAPVSVVSPLPLPVTGSLGVSGTINAAQSGAWNVGINNATTSPVPVRDVENPARQPFGQQHFCSLSGGDHCLVLFSVPAGKLLVIESVTVAVAVQPGQVALATITTIPGGPAVTSAVSLTPQGTFGGFAVFTGTHLIRLYAAPGSDVVAIADRSSTTGTGSMSAAIHGHLVDCGAGTGCPIP